MDVLFIIYFFVNETAWRTLQIDRMEWYLHIAYELIAANEIIQ